MKINIFGKTFLLGAYRLKKLALVFFVLAVVIAVACWALFFRAPSPDAGPEGGATGGMWGPRGAGSGFGFGRPQAVSAGVVRQMDIRMVVSALGTMTALNTATVRAKVDAELKALHFKEGALVKAGQVLVDLDTQNLDVLVTQAQGQLERDTAQYKNALVDQQRYKELLAKDAIAAQQVDTQDALVRQLKGTVLIDQGNFDNARLQLSYAHVTAPISGRIGIKQVEIGSLVRASDPNGIATITQFQPIAAVFAVPEKYVPLIQKKLHQGVPIPVEVWDSELTQVLGVGKVSLTDNAIDTSTGTLKLKALLDNKDESLFPNQFTNIKVQLDVFKNVTAVPAAAVQRGALGTFVYVINDDNTVTPRVVKLLALDGEWQGVESAEDATGSLKVGDRVVLDGADRLRAKSKVDVVKTTDARGVTSISNVDAVGANRAANGASNANSAASASSSNSVGAAGLNKNAARATPQPSVATPNAVGSKSAETASQLSNDQSNLIRKPNESNAQGNATSSGASDGVDNSDEARRRKWMERLPPEIVDKVKAMSPEERKAFFQKMRERRQQSSGD